MTDFFKQTQLLQEVDEKSQKSYFFLALKIQFDLKLQQTICRVSMQTFDKW